MLALRRQPVQRGRKRIDNGSGAQIASPYPDNNHRLATRAKFDGSIFNVTELFFRDG